MRARFFKSNPTLEASMLLSGNLSMDSLSSMREVPASTSESDAMSKELKQRGFTFVGSTICYAFMQSVGMVNDHVVECFRWREVQALAQKSPSGETTSS